MILLKHEWISPKPSTAEEAIATADDAYTRVGHHDRSAINFKKSRQMVAKEKQGASRFLVSLAIVLLLVYCVSLSVFLVHLMRDHGLLKQHVQDLQSRVNSLTEGRVSTGEVVLASGDHKPTNENKESKLHEAQQVGTFCMMRNQPTIYI